MNPHMTIHPLVVVVGSRFHTDRAMVEHNLYQAVTELLDGGPVIVAHGQCDAGAELYAQQWAARQPGEIVAHLEGFPLNLGLGPKGRHARAMAIVERAYVQQKTGGNVIVLSFPMDMASRLDNTAAVARSVGIATVREVPLAVTPIYAPSAGLDPFRVAAA